VGEAPNQTTARKSGPLKIIQYSLGRSLPKIYSDVYHYIDSFTNNLNA